MPQRCVTCNEFMALCKCIRPFQEKKNHQHVYVTELPPCDFCKAKASYDGKTIHGPWAFMCQEHFRAHGVGLGLGRGQQLLIHTQANDILDALKRRSEAC